MLISIHDKSLKRVAFLDNDKPGTLHYFDDTWHRYLVEATSTFDFTVPKPLEAHSDLAFLTEKNYVSFRYGSEDYLFNIMKVVETEDALTCSCENLNLELLNETDPAHEAAGAKTFVQYLTVCGIQFARLTLGVNEISDRSRTLSWEGTDTKLARLLSIVKQFDAECEFVTVLARDGSLEKMVLNVYKSHDESNQGVGRRRSDVTLYYGREIKSVRRTVDKTGLYTAINPTGKDGLTIASLNKTELDSDGNVLFKSPAGDTHILCPSVMAEYPAQFLDSNADRYINLDWSYDTDNVNTLYSKALAKIKSVYQPAITYEAEGSLALDIGDTVIIHDAKFTPTLLLEARVSEQEVSFSNPTQNNNVFANFRALENQLSSDITSRLATIVENALPYTMEVLSSDGLIFKNGEGSTTLTPRVLKGQKDVTAQVATAWYKDGVATGLSGVITVMAADIAGKAIYKVAATSDAGAVLCSADVTIVDISDGGTGPPGTDVQSVVLYHLLQLSTLAAPAKPTVASPNGWSQTEPTYSGDDTKTLYTCIKTVYGDGSFEWGPVNVSSTYDAAKSAYNKAQSALLKLEPDALTMTISSALSGSNTITTTKFVMDKNGLLIKNGGLSIQNNAGATVLSADAEGNLSMTGNLKLLGAQSMAICDNEAVEIGKVYFGINRRQGYDYKCTQILAHQALELHAGDINKPADTNQFGACYARGGAMIGWGYDKTTGRRWATLGATDDSSPLLDGVTVDTGSSPKVSATGCTIVSTSFSMASGFSKTSEQNQIVKNALGDFCVLTFSVVGQVNATTHTRIFTLPEGYRPPSSIFIPGVGGVYGWFQIRIDSNGDVVVWHPSGMTSMRGSAVFYI